MILFLSVLFNFVCFYLYLILWDILFSDEQCCGCFVAFLDILVLTVSLFSNILLLTVSLCVVFLIFQYSVSLNFLRFGMI